MRKLNKLTSAIRDQGNFLAVAVTAAALGGGAVSLPAEAETLTEFLDLPDEVWIGGRLKQGTGVYYDTYGDDSGWGPSQFIAELQMEWTPSRNVTVISDFWLRGDWFYQLDDGEHIGPGLQDFTKAPPFLDRFDFLLTENGSLMLPEPFGNDGSDNELLDDFEKDVIRELSVSFTDDAGNISFKLGKFQRGWGQSDGLRLLDIVNPQDLRQRTFFTDPEELRITQWSAALSLDLDALNMGGMFDAIGLEKSSLELIYTPFVRHSEFIVNNPTPSRSASGGPFGLPFPAMIDGESGFGLPLLGARLSERETKDWEDSEFGFRLKFDVLGGQGTINGFYGFQDLPIVVNTGSTLHIGTFLNDPNAENVVNVPLDLATTIGAVHAPGQYVDFIQALAGGTAAPGDFPLLPFGCMDLLNPAGGGAACSITADFDLDYTYRQKTLGFSFTRDMAKWRFGPKNVSPVMRVEASYEFDKAFNKGTIANPFVPGDVSVGTPALITTQEDTVGERDQISLMVGLDYNVWIPGWESQRSSIFMTTQFFNIHTEDADGLLFQAPYALTEVEMNQQYMSQTYTIGLFNDKLILDGLLLLDLSKGGVAYRQRIDYSMFANQLLARLELGHFSSDPEQGLLGLYRKSDYVELSLTYQF